MGDFIIRTGDLLRVTISPPAEVPMLAAPVPLLGSAETLSVCGMSACLVGDELPVELQVPMPYTAPPFTNPGMGKLTLKLLPTNMTQQTSCGGKLLIKGSAFEAIFTVETPATQPSVPAPLPDLVAVKSGTAQFETTNATVKAG